MSHNHTLHRLAIGLSVVACASFVVPAFSADETPNKKNKAEREKVAGGSKEKSNDRAPEKAAQNNGPNKNNREKTTGGYDRLRMGPNGIPMPADRTASIEAKRDLDEAKTQLTAALGSSTNSSAAAIDNVLMKDDDYRQAALDLRRAQADYDAVRRPIFDALRADQYYKELEKREHDRQRVISNLVLTGRGSFDWLFPHAMAALEVRKRMTREEIISLAQAPEVEDARERMLVAAAKVRAMKSNHIAQTTNSDAARASKTELDNARERLKQAQQTYNGALANEADYEQIRQQYLAEVRRTGKVPVAGN